MINDDLCQSILLVEDDDVDILTVNRIIDSYFDNYNMDIVKTINELDIYLQQNNDLLCKIIVLDLSLIDGDTIEYIQYFKKKYPLKKVIITSGQTDIRTAFDTLNRGADFYVCKGENFDIDFLSSILAANALCIIEAQNRHFRELIGNEDEYPCLIFKMSDMGPEIYLRDFIVFPDSNIKDCDLFLGNLSVSVLTALGQGHNYNEGIFELPAGESEKFSIFTFSFKLADDSVDDVRIRKYGYVVFVLFVPTKYRRYIRSPCISENKLLGQFKQVSNVNEIDIQYLKDRKFTVIQWMNDNLL